MSCLQGFDKYQKFDWVEQKKRIDIMITDIYISIYEQNSKTCLIIFRGLPGVNLMTVKC